MNYDGYCMWLGSFRSIIATCLNSWWPVASCLVFKGLDTERWVAIFQITLLPVMQKLSNSIGSHTWLHTLMQICADTCMVWVTKPTPSSRCERTPFSGVELADGVFNIEKRLGFLGFFHQIQGFLHMVFPKNHGFIVGVSHSQHYH